MTQLHIGRIGISSAQAPVITNVEEIVVGEVDEENGVESVTIKFNLDTSDSARLTAWIRQLRGYSSLPQLQEYAIPVRLDTWPELDGFYRPVGLSLPIGPGTLDEVEVVPAEMKLERVAQSSRPKANQRVFGIVRSNDNGVVAADCLPWCAFPVGTQGGVLISGVTDTAISPAFKRESYDGDVVILGATAYNSKLWNALLAYDADPTNWYLAAVTAAKANEVFTLGTLGSFLSTTDLVTGLQTPHNPSGWYMGNQLVVTWPDPSTVGKFHLLAYDPDTNNYSIYTTYTHAALSGLTLVSATWLENTLARCCMRLDYVNTTTGQITTLVMTLRRGSRYIEFYGEVPSGGTLPTWGISEDNLGGSATATTTAGGRVTNNADATSNKFVTAINRAPTTLNNGVRATTAVATASYMFGLVINGGSAVTGDRADDMVRQWYAAVDVLVDIGAMG